MIRPPRRSTLFPYTPLFRSTTPAATNRSGAVRTVPSSRREMRPKANTTVASTTRSNTVSSDGVGDPRTVQTWQAYLSREDDHRHFSAQEASQSGGQRGENYGEEHRSPQHDCNRRHPYPESPFVEY